MKNILMVLIFKVVFSSSCFNNRQLVVILLNKIFINILFMRLFAKFGLGGLSLSATFYVGLVAYS